MRNLRLRYRCLYSAVYLNKFFYIAVSQTAASVLRPFNFVTASRLGNEVSLDHADHLLLFYRLRIDHGLSYDTIGRFVTSTILLDAYPPKMYRKYPRWEWGNNELIQHSDFNPNTVYDAIYHPSCLRSLVSLFKARSYSEIEVAKQAED